MKINIEVTDKKVMEYLRKKQSTFFYWKKREPKLYRMAIKSFVMSELITKMKIDGI